MGQPIEITNLEYSAADLRWLASREKDGQVVRRLLKLALILEGHSRIEAAQVSGMDRQTLRDWVHHYNAEGSAELISRSGLGPTPLLSAAQIVDVACCGHSNCDSPAPTSAASCESDNCSRIRSDSYDSSCFWTDR